MGLRHHQAGGQLRRKLLPQCRHGQPASNPARPQCVVDQWRPYVRLADTLSVCGVTGRGDAVGTRPRYARTQFAVRSEEHTSELQSLMRISYAVFCLKKKKK